MKINGLQKLTLLDYPGHTACTVFTSACNFRCPFCHNASLVECRDLATVPEEEFFAFLEKRHGILDGVAITGAAYVVKFREAERTVRVSSDNMPEDGQRVFGEIEQVLRKAWKIYGPKQ